MGRALALLLVSLLALPALASAAGEKTIDACRLVTRTQVERTFGPPVDIRHGATRSNCVIRGGGLAPVVAVTSTGGVTAYRRIVRAAAQRPQPLRLGTQAVSYEARFGDPETVARGVIVRKGRAVLHVSTSGVGDDPAGLASVAQLVTLARFATARL